MLCFGILEAFGECELISCSFSTQHQYTMLYYTKTPSRLLLEPSLVEYIKFMDLPLLDPSFILTSSHE